LLLINERLLKFQSKTKKIRKIRTAVLSRSRKAGISYTGLFHLIINSAKYESATKEFWILFFRKFVRTSNQSMNEAGRMPIEVVIPISGNNPINNVQAFIK
jgi:hypothetical protein